MRRPLYMTLSICLMLMHSLSSTAFNRVEMDEEKSEQLFRQIHGIADDQPVDRALYISMEQLIQEKLAILHQQAQEVDLAAQGENAIDEFIAARLRPHLPFTDADYQAEGKDKVSAITAVCYFAAEIQSVTPLLMMKDRFDYIPELHRWFFDDRVPPGKILKDFPLMYLAYECREKSIPALQAIVLDSALDNTIRIRAFAVLRLIDKSDAELTYRRVEKTLPAQAKGKFIGVLNNPTIRPWDAQAPSAPKPN